MPTALAMLISVFKFELTPEVRASVVLHMQGLRGSHPILVVGFCTHLQQRVHWLTAPACLR